MSFSALAPAAPAAALRGGHHSRQAGGAAQRTAPHRRAVVQAAAQSGGGTTPGQSWDAARAAWRSQAVGVQAQLQAWLRRQRLDERLSEAARAAAKTAAEQAARVDAEYAVREKAAEAAAAAAGAARNVNEAAEDLDSRFQFRRRARIAWADFRRLLPLVWRQSQDFMSTPLGAVCFFFAFLVSVFTGAFWVIARAMVGALWLTVLVSPMLLNWLNVRAMREQRERYREYAEEQRRRRENPWSGTIFASMFGGGSRRNDTMDSQDVIDVSFTHIYESE